MARRIERRARQRLRARAALAADQSRVIVWQRVDHDDEFERPEVEQAVVGRHSYGRQIGRMMDALQVLIHATPGAGHDRAVKDFLERASEVTDAKDAAKRAQLVRLYHELSALKKRDPTASERLIKA